ncbi:MULTISPECIES: 4Fe-4S dicluster domain-containing protein [Desulfobacula]|uniref:PadC2: phenylacetyl-CoA:acceptor oxidoreductase, subunit C n=2 Tax=Desulfobacula TaxID=28222 RepID=K0NCP5_DESTT|nr:MULTISPECIES: 4Fe-4S dicluster domain-containing protein [Desulfobacula]CCK82319.1 PadC2: phenylacetyl-CoA:acceptor oxidoreductase, subunit C [Desulfobacula toluolica Tol2]SDU51139.1 prokaryotic molybdopterin-containing oxidoreductase family, iron-sulfur binding subunit [Desulfobacula phenolica]
MTVKWGMVLDLKRCIGCNACTVACKQENSVPAGINWTETLSEEIGTYPNVTRAYIPTTCNHCEDAPCARVCPTGATYITDDGIVLVDDNKCIGCGACITACPYKKRAKLAKEPFEKGLYTAGEITPFEVQGYTRFTVGTAVKCTFCHERVNQGLDPACVVTCPTEARIFGDLNDPESKPRKLIQARKGYQALSELNTKPKVFYVD